jgi:hypothetical protein
MSDVITWHQDDGPEVYAHDDQGALWASFESPAGEQCALCGRTITRSWVCANGRHVCLDDVTLAGDTFTVSELAYAAGTGEPAMRRMLNAGGATPRLDEHSKDRTERIPRQMVIDLVAL